MHTQTCLQAENKVWFERIRQNLVLSQNNMHWLREKVNDSEMRDHFLVCRYTVDLSDVASHAPHFAAKCYWPSLHPNLTGSLQALWLVLIAAKYRFWLSSVSTSAWDWSKYSAIMMKFPSAASHKAVRLTESLAFISAPYFNSDFAVSKRFLREAASKGVSPSAAAWFTLAPLLNNTSTTWSWPSLQAYSKTVVPLSSTTSFPLPFWSKNSTIGTPALLTAMPQGLVWWVKVKLGLEGLNDFDGYVRTWSAPQGSNTTGRCN